MDRQPLTDFDRALLQAITMAVFDLERHLLLTHESEYVDRWERSIDCLETWMVAHAADHPSRGWKRGIAFPTSTDSRDDPIYQILSPEEALEIAHQLEQRVEVCGFDGRPWQWWQVASWCWDQDFELEVGHIEEIIAALRAGADYVTYGPESWPVGADKLREPAIEIEPDWNGSGDTPGWEAEVKLAGGLGVITLYRGPDDPDWYLYGDLAHFAMSQETWEKLKPALDAAVEAKRPEVEAMLARGES